MSQLRYLLDTHAVIFWSQKTTMSADFLLFLDKTAQGGDLFVSSVSFWEMALLVKKGRIATQDVSVWKDQLLEHSGVRLLDPTADEMIRSVSLPTHHKDPFDRLLILQATKNNMLFVTQDKTIERYDVQCFWMS